MAYSNQTVRRLLRIGTCVCLLGTAFLLSRAIRTPKPKLAMRPLADSEIASPNELSKSKLTRAIRDFDPLLERSLSGPLYDAPPEEEEQPPEEPQPTELAEDIESSEPEALPPIDPQPKDIGLRVIGTMIETGRSIAIFVDSAGSIRLSGEGDSIETDAGNARIDRIRLREVTVSVDGDQRKLPAP